jgi:anti-sigma B factor antagonist
MSSCACLQQPTFVPALIKEPKLTLRLEIRERPDMAVIYCEGRMVYRDENPALSAKVLEILSRTRQIVLDLSGVEIIDGFGLGELVTVLNLANTKNSTVKLAAPNRLVYSLLKLTKLNSLFEIYPTVHEAEISQSAALASARC